MKCKIVTGPSGYNLNNIFVKSESDYVIGADQGALILSNENITFDLALGDFDSVGQNDVETIKRFAKEIITYPIKKDHTDSYLAVLEALKRGYTEIEIVGGIGGRLDHTLANINLLKLGNITIVTENEIVYLLDPGVYEIKNDFKYISFFALEDVKDLSLKGFEYELENVMLDTYDPLCISNQKEGSVAFTEGLLLVIHQNE